jgi:hypothetical protein
MRAISVFKGICFQCIDRNTSKTHIVSLLATLNALITLPAEMQMSGARKKRSLETHREFFHTARLLEHRVALWHQKNPETPLADHLQSGIPLFDSSCTVTFGDLMKELHVIADRHRCKVDPPRPELLDLRLDSRAVYAICLFIAYESSNRCFKVKGMEEILALTQEIVALVECFPSVVHPDRDEFGDFGSVFSRHAQMTFRNKFDRLDLFNHGYIEKRVAGIEPALRNQYGILPGLFFDRVFLSAILAHSGETGLHQAAKMKTRHEKNSSLSPA